MQGACHSPPCGNSRMADDEPTCRYQSETVSALAIMRSFRSKTRNGPAMFVGVWTNVPFQSRRTARRSWNAR